MRGIDTELLTEILMSGAPESEIADLMSESYFKEERAETSMEYLYLFEQYLDDCSVYAFSGWEEGLVVNPPKITKFWVEVEIAFPKSLDMDGARRILGKNNQNTVKVKSKEDRFVLVIRVLRSVLDQLEEINRIEAKKDADNEGYKDDQAAQPQQQQPPQQPDMTMPGQAPGMPPQGGTGF